MIAAILSSQDDPAEAVRAFARASAAVLEASDYAEGCPIATMTLEAAHTSESIRAACSANYVDWQRLLSDYLVAHGMKRGRADELGLAVLALVEGGLILCRAERSAAPLERLADFVADFVAKEMAGLQQPPPKGSQPPVRRKGTGPARAGKTKPPRR
jgi:TetR/AcrR family transcriptional repressor of lmrAB and yxaGH operons